MSQNRREFFLRLLHQPRGFRDDLPSLRRRRASPSRESLGCGVDCGAGFFARCLPIRSNDVVGVGRLMLLTVFDEDDSTTYRR